MEERKACDQLKRRFEQAGFRMAENVAFDEDGVRVELDGFDAAHRVGYEYVTAEAGDGWDVDADVIATLARRHQAGEVHILVVDETAAPDQRALDREVDRFLAELKAAGVSAGKAEARVEKPAAGKKPAAKNAAKPPPTPPAKKPAAAAVKKPAAAKKKKR